ncbi:MAG: FtsQ-type POTRA domain-containing protein [Halieaceae bacterium]|jgi:cell division protein FtsQ|nr:FtsQ-type POTRA domain-containing protein [Halieaceae bacterium]
MATGATRKMKAQPRSTGGGIWLRRIVAGAVGCGLLALVALAGWQLLSLPVNRVVVSGEMQQLSRDELMAVISDSLSGGFLWLDLQTVREPLESLPWVHRAVVRRQWPDSIEVQVVEQRPIAHWRDDAYLNHAGEVFRPGNVQPLAGLPTLSGPEGSQAELMNRYRKVQEQLQPLGLKVTALQMSSRGGLTAQLEGGGELVFGRDGLDEKLTRLTSIYRARLAARRDELARVDLRYSQGAAVAWLTDKKQET